MLWTFTACCLVLFLDTLAALSLSPRLAIHDDDDDAVVVVAIFHAVVSPPPGRAAFKIERVRVRRRADGCAEASCASSS